ncbi:hypothetical protein AWJ20_3144 [Sugiyamaella lignohabitans]|uniref:Nucleoporin POM34 n=1 Tax=Sugiyamaella lignohabitans TaxID=796027 RepID=A0A167FNM5_9ASCO|nr:uncharacterized protein AWJ20_3144 [Sugiyamaella lignohabitans]ANB15516.1 hypothetical protein AWJ20_3144 [Sugiyamaella lignohabitans]
MSFERSSFANSLYQSGSSPSKNNSVNSPGTPARNVGTGAAPVTPFSNIIGSSPGYGNSNTSFSPAAANSTFRSSPQQPYSQNQYAQSSPKTANDLRVKTSNNNFINASLSTPKTPLQRILPSSSSAGSAPNTPASPNSGNGNAKSATSSTSVPTGTWEHPSMKEIRKRTVNKELVLSRVLKNVAALVILSGAESVTKRVLNNFSWSSELIESQSLGDAIKYVKYFIWLVYVLLIYNIVTGVSQFIKPQEKFDDLPITSSQRKLLGLPASPNSATSSPSPPRYLKSSPQARVSPRGSSPLSRTSTASSSSSQASVSPLAKISTPSRSGTSLLSPSSSERKQQPVPSKVASGSPLATKSTSTATNNTTTSVASSTPTKTASTATQSSVSFTPTGRYVYLSESSPRRRSGLVRNI